MKKLFNTLLIIVFLIILVLVIKFIIPVVQINNLPKNITSEVILSLSDKDEQKLSKMFCEEITSSQNFDNQLHKACEFFDGKVVSFSLTGVSWDKKDSTKGSITKMSMSPLVENIATSSDKIYSIRIYANIIDNDNPNIVGISQLIIIEEGGKEIIVGEYIE